MFCLDAVGNIGEQLQRRAFRHRLRPPAWPRSGRFLAHGARHEIPPGRSTSRTSIHAVLLLGAGVAALHPEAAVSLYEHGRHYPDVVPAKRRT